MDKFALRPDLCDNQIMRFSNCLNMLSCICDIAGLFNRNLLHLAHLLHVVSDVVFYTVIGLMAAQTLHEVNAQASAGQVLFPNDDPIVLSDPHATHFTPVKGGDYDRDRDLLEEKKRLL